MLLRALIREHPTLISTANPHEVFASRFGQFLIVGGHSSQWEKEGEASVLDGLPSSTPEQPRYSAYRVNVRIVCQPPG